MLPGRVFSPPQRHPVAAAAVHELQRRQQAEVGEDAVQG